MTSSPATDAPTPLHHPRTPSRSAAQLFSRASPSRPHPELTSGKHPHAGSADRSEIVDAYSLRAHPRPPDRALSPSLSTGSKAGAACWPGRRPQRSRESASILDRCDTISIVAIRSVSNSMERRRDHYVQPDRVTTHQACSLVDRRRPRGRGFAPQIPCSRSASPRSKVRSSRLAKLFRGRPHETRTI